ncbi:MAG: hypothetical protein H0U95_19460 [Bacteroidetes bacterium]|nr:hypothetical protein [Bacteroidota bacterium]
MNNNNKPKYISALNSINLLGEKEHRNFLEVQAEFGIAQRGGAFPHNIIPSHINRLASDINFLTSQEKKQLIFSGNIFNN